MSTPDIESAMEQFSEIQSNSQRRRRKRPQEPHWFAEPVKITPAPRPVVVYAPNVEVDTRPRQGVPVDWSLELLGNLEWKRFEDVVANYFTRQGYRAETTRIGADGGVDVYLYRDPDSAPVAVVQCKAWNVYDVGAEQYRAGGESCARPRT